MGTAEVRRGRQLEDEVRRLKHLVADLSLDKQILQEVLAKKSLKPSRKRQLVIEACGQFGVSERRGCAVLALERSAFLRIRS
jgi:putative transposase